MFRSLLFCFYFYCSVDHRDLHSFPTRRSFDLYTDIAGDPVLYGNLPPREISMKDVFRSGDSSKKFKIAEEIGRSEERFSRNAETDLVCRLLLEKKKKTLRQNRTYNKVSELLSL